MGNHKSPNYSNISSGITSTILLVVLLFNFWVATGIYATCPYISGSLKFCRMPPDTVPENQVLYNGRVWKNLYYMIENDQFLFSREFLPASLTIFGKTYTNINIKYDIYNDEILTPSNPGGILQINKEMVDSFSVFFQSKTYQFIKIPEGSLEGLQGYVNVIYKGKSALYVKYIKKIDRPTVQNEYDNFYQISRIYFVKDNTLNLITNKSDLFKILGEDKAKIKNFIKKNNFVVSKKNPESFYPVLRYYDSINP